MTFLPGDVVRSAAGHDRGDLFLVCRAEGDFLWLADGKRRKIETPKKKRRKHVVSTGVWTHPAIDCLRNGEPVLLSFFCDLPRIKRFDTALQLQNKCGTLICFDFQREALERYCSGRVKFQTIDFEKWERSFFE